MSIQNPRDIYVRTTQSNGKSSVSQHRVWDAELFLKTQQESGKKAGQKNAKEGYTVSLVTEAEYRGNK